MDSVASVAYFDPHTTGLRVSAVNRNLSARRRELAHWREGSCRDRPRRALCRRTQNRLKIENAHADVASAQRLSKREQCYRAKTPSSVRANAYSSWWRSFVVALR